MVFPEAQVCQMPCHPEAPLDANRGYTLTIGVGALDHAGTPLASPFTLTFRTVRTSLSAATLFPADGVAGVAVDTPVAIIFDRALDPEEVGDDLVSIEPSVAGSLDVIAPPGAAGLRDPEQRMLRFQPSGPLEPNTTYEITLRPGLRGADGAGLPAAISWSFTTGAPTATLSNQVVFLSDRAGIANLWAMNPDGTNQHQLSAEVSPVIDYAVAPDGRAFVTGDGAAIVWQRADGSARRLLTDTGVVEFDPVYTPDGASLVFGRADPLLGTGLGLWMSDAEGSDPQPVEMPSDEGGSPSPTPATPIPLLRTPRISPDGTALAFVDGAGLVAILDLETDQLTTAPFSALSEPVWLPDSSAVLVSGFAAGFRAEPFAYLPGTPVALLDPASADLDAGQVAALKIVRFERGAASVSSTALRGGAARPVVDDGGRIAYLKLEVAGAQSGGPWLTSALDDPGDRAMGDPAARATFAAFTPERGALLVSRVSLVGAVTTRATGVWLVDLRTGTARQLSKDGWLPRWLP